MNIEKLFPILGFIIYISLSIVDKHFMRLPDYFYITGCLISGILIILGIILNRKKK